MSFNELGLRPELIETVIAKGYTKPTPIQANAIPAILEGHDILGGSQTGTGKTAAFSLPILQKLAAKPSRSRAPRALVMTPTRELAAQVHQSIVDYGKELNLYSTVIFGGVGYPKQIRALRQGIDILVATPGRLLDLMDQGEVDLRQIEILVLDEADRMLDMGFIHDIKKVLKVLPSERQTLFFSATYNQAVKKLADSMLNDPQQIEVTPRNTTAERVFQEAYHVGQKAKRALLINLIEEEDWEQVLVFTRTKHGANRLATQLEKARIPAMAIHGNKSQSAREKALSAFKANRVQVLVATDIAARGLDINDLPYVVNYELPNVSEDYVHRIGRTGRAGKEGKAISFTSDDEIDYFLSIERLLKKEIPLFTMNGEFQRRPYDRKKRPLRANAVKPKRSGGQNRNPSNRRRRGPASSKPQNGPRIRSRSRAF